MFYRKRKSEKSKKDIFKKWNSKLLIGKRNTKTKQERRIWNKNEEKELEIKE